MWVGLSVHKYNPLKCPFWWRYPYPGSHLIHGCAGPADPYPKRHGDRFSRLAKVTLVNGRHTYRPVAIGHILCVLTRIAPGGETICARRGKNRGGSTDGCAVHTSLMAGGGEAAGSQRAYGLDSCATGQTDGWITLFQNAP